MSHIHILYAISYASATYSAPMNHTIPSWHKSQVKAKDEEIKHKLRQNNAFLNAKDPNLPAVLSREEFHQDCMERIYSSHPTLVQACPTTMTKWCSIAWLAGTHKEQPGRAHLALLPRIEAASEDSDDDLPAVSPTYQAIPIILNNKLSWYVQA